jgi:NADH-quinone oxidoreductase subunit H
VPDLGLGWLLFTPVGFLAFVCFFISALAEGERTPFDIPEADSEIVAGYMTEYSGMKFGMFYLAQYVLNFALCAITATLFFGGWQGPGVSQLSAMGANNQLFSILAGALGVVYLLLKTYLFFFTMVWIRGAFPRLRIDQLMGLGWKFLLPLTLVNIFSAAIWAACIHWGPEQGLAFLSAFGPWKRWAIAFLSTFIINLLAATLLVRINSSAESSMPKLVEDQKFGAVTLP